MLSDGIHLHLRAKPDLGSWKTSMTKLHPYTIEELIDSFKLIRMCSYAKNKHADVLSHSTSV